MRAVFDTTILASLSIATRDPLLFLRRATEQRLFELCTSDFIFDELGRTLKKPYFVSRLPDQGTAFLAMLRHVTTLVPLTVTIAGVVSDPQRSHPRNCPECPRRLPCLGRPGRARCSASSRHTNHHRTSVLRCLAATSVAHQSTHTTALTRPFHGSSHRRNGRAPYGSQSSCHRHCARA